MSEWVSECEIDGLVLFCIDCIIKSALFSRWLPCAVTLCTMSSPARPVSTPATHRSRSPPGPAAVPTARRTAPADRPTLKFAVKLEQPRHNTTEVSSVHLPVTVAKLEGKSRPHWQERLPHHGADSLSVLAHADVRDPQDEALVNAEADAVPGRRLALVATSVDAQATASSSALVMAAPTTSAATSAAPAGPPLRRTSGPEGTRAAGSFGRIQSDQIAQCIRTARRLGLDEPPWRITDAVVRPGGVVQLHGVLTIGSWSGYLYLPLCSMSLSGDAFALDDWFLAAGFTGAAPANTLVEVFRAEPRTPATHPVYFPSEVVVPPNQNVRAYPSDSQETLPVTPTGLETQLYAPDSAR